MTSRLFKTLAITFALSCGLVAAPLLAAPSIDAVSFGSGVSFSTDFAYGQAWLRVTGPASYVHEEKFGSLDDLSIAIEAGAVDGRYSWEILALAPISDDTLAKLETARSDAGLVDRLKKSGELSSATFHGSFEMRSGLVELPTANVSTDDRDVALKDLITGDLYVDGSLCAGFDCVNGESFGSDTLRLKENNLRIHFEDTSSSSNFPSNDWRLVANDSSNNGDNYFSIVDSTGNKTPFRTDAGAPTDSIRIKSDGKVGLGTSAPAVDLHVVSGNSPTLRLEQDGSSGFQTQIWDLAGNEANFFVRNVTNGSLLPFRIKPDAAKNTLFLSSAGIGSGVSDSGPKAPLHIRGGGAEQDPSNSAVLALFQNNAAASDGAIVSIMAGNGSANAQMWFGDADNDKAGRIIYRNGSDAMSFWSNGSEQLFIESDGQVCIGCNDTQGDAIRHSNGAVLTAGGTWTNASSRGLKQDISELSGAEAMAALDGLAPVTYRYKAELDETYVGFIAEDVPELVAMKDRKSLTSMDVVAVLTKVVQEQQKAMQDQQRTIDALAVLAKAQGFEIE